VRFSKMASLTALAGVLFMVDAFQGLAAGPPADHHPVGQSFRDCIDACPEMVEIPPGKFTIGSSTSERGRGSDENPQQKVTIAYALAVGKYPVTRGEFAAFVKDTGRILGPCEHWTTSHSESKKVSSGTTCPIRPIAIRSYAWIGMMDGPMFNGCREKRGTPIAC
jgi:hypothetical protein